MKTTVEIPDDLFRAAKSYAALTGTKLKDVIVSGLKLKLAEKAGSEQAKRVKFPLLKSSAPGSLTLEMIDEAERQMDEQEALQIARSLRR